MPAPSKDLLEAELEGLLIEDLSIRTHYGSMQSYVDLTIFLPSCEDLAKITQV
jgi:hypothetical protein